MIEPTGQIPDTLRPIICNHCRPNPMPESPRSPAVSNGSGCSGVTCIQGKLQEWGGAALAGDSWQPQSRNPSPLGLQPSNGSYCSRDELFSEACHPLVLLHLQLPLAFFTEVMLNYLFTTSPLIPDSSTLPFVKVLCQVGVSPSAWNSLRHWLHGIFQHLGLPPPLLWEAFFGFLRLGFIPFLRVHRTQHIILCLLCLFSPLDVSSLRAGPILLDYLGTQHNIQHYEASFWWTLAAWTNDGFLASALMRQFFRLVRSKEPSLVITAQIYFKTNPWKTQEDFISILRINSTHHVSFYL